MSVRRVRPGSLVDVIAPSGPFDVERFKEGVALLEARGLTVRFRDDIFARERFLAGTDERRRDELLAALRAPDSDLLWAARGGYGTTRLLDSIPLDEIRRAEKLLVGFSDLTSLHLRWHAAGVPSIHGSMVAFLSRRNENELDRLFRMFFTDQPARALHGDVLVEGRAEGTLVGGNLALLGAMCGTPYQQTFREQILFIEDITEPPFRMDRVFTQLRQAGVLDGVRGLVFGEFTDCEMKDGSATSASVVAEFAKNMGVPALAGLPCGHGDVNDALPFGTRVRVDTEKRELAFLESLYGAGA